MTVCLLGGFSVAVNGRQVTENNWQRRHARQLVKLLAIAPNHQLQREQLLENLWPDSSPKDASNQLSKIVYLARRALEPELTRGNQSCFLHRDGTLITLHCRDGLSIDADIYRSAAERALNGTDLASYVSAAALYTGSLLPEDRYEFAFIEPRESLQLLQQRLLTRLADIAIDSGELDQALNCLRQLAIADPANEDTHRRLMQLYVRSGQRARALKQFHVCADAVRHDYGAQPDPSTQSLFEQIRDGLFELPGLMSDIGRTEDKHASIDSVAVMPFTNALENSEIDYLCEGITDNLIFRLSQIRNLRVMARSTVYRVKMRSDDYGQHLDPQGIGKELSVDSVVLGRIQQTDLRLVLWVELVAAADGSVIWTQRYTNEHEDILLLQDALCTDISSQLQRALSSAIESGPESEREHALRPASSATGACRPVRIDVSAYHEYLKGRYHWNKRSADSLQLAIRHFQRALDFDPVYAAAYAGLADCYNLLSLYTSVAPHASMPKARAAAQQAIAIDPDSAEAYTSLAYCQLSYEWNWREAESSFKRALELNPDYATAHQWYHKQLIAMARFDDAEKQISIAKQLDPLSLMIGAEQGWGLYHSRQYESAQRHISKLLLEAPSFAMASYLSGLVHLQLGDFSTAIETLEQAVSLQSLDRPFVLGIGVLANALVQAGKTDKALQRLDHLRCQDEHALTLAYAESLIHVACGEFDLAISALRQSSDGRLDRMIFLNVEPLFDPLRNNPDFQQLASNIAVGSAVRVEFQQA